METKYILVEWPESQYFIGIKSCYYVQSSINDPENLDGALFVPEDIYKKFLLEPENTEFNYGHNVNHKVEK